MRFGKKTITELKKAINGRRNVYCFGAGIALARFLREFQEYHLEENIKCVVDNSKKKQGTMIQECGKAIPVISFEQMLCEIVSGDVVLITTARIEEIIELLSKEKKLQDTECYLYNILRIEWYDDDRLKIAVPEKISTLQDQRIPKIIHYCWFGGKPIPEQYRKWMDSWKQYCSEYEIIEWNEKNYDVKKNKYVRQAYEQEKWAFVSDYARIDVVNEYGGIYLDTDVELIRNIDEMLKNQAFCGFESRQYVNYGLGYGAVKQYPLITEIKEYYDALSFVSEDGSLNLTPCPMIQTEVMKKHGLIENGEFQVVAGMAVYPSKMMCGMSPCSFRIQRDMEHTYAIHHFSASWVGEKRRDSRMATLSYMKQRNGTNANYYYEK